MSETAQQITGADAIQALIDVKAKLAKVWEWRLSLQAANRGAERAQASFEAKERELLTAIARLAADEPASFGGPTVSPDAEHWIDEHADVMRELLTTSNDFLTDVGFPSDQTEANGHGS